MKIEKLIDSLIKNIGGFNIKKLVELIIKIIINFFKFTDYLSKNLLKIKEVRKNYFISSSFIFTNRNLYTKK